MTSQQQQQQQIDVDGRQRHAKPVGQQFGPDPGFRHLGLWICWGIPALNGSNLSFPSQDAYGGCCER